MRYGFDPGATPEEMAEMKDYSKEREGYFHRWVDDIDTSKDVPYVKTVALVEDAENGRMHGVEYDNLRFIDD